MQNASPRLWESVDEACGIDCIQVLSSLLPQLRAKDLFSVLARVYVGQRVPTGLWAVG